MINTINPMINTLNPDALICVFCEGFIAEAIDYANGSQYCVPCHEYKGIITVREYLEEWS